MPQRNNPACDLYSGSSLPDLTARRSRDIHLFSSPVSSQSTDLPNSRLMARFPLVSGIRLRDELSVLIFRFDVLRRAVEN